MNVFCLGAEQIDNLWDLYSRHLERFERETKLLRAADLREDLKLAKKQLWGYQDGPDILGIVITHIFQTPTGPCCEIVAACGTQSRKGQIDELFAAIEEWARNIGCKRIRILGRPGWQRRLKEFTQVGIILEREIQ